MTNEPIGYTTRRAIERLKERMGFEIASTSSQWSLSEETVPLYLAPQNKFPPIKQLVWKETLHHTNGDVYPSWTAENPFGGNIMFECRDYVFKNHDQVPKEIVELKKKIIQEQFEKYIRACFDVTDGE